MDTLRILLIFICSIAFAGCSAHNQTFDQLDTVSQDARVAEKSRNCESFGYRRGTEAFAACVQLAVIQHDRTATQRRQAIAAALNTTTTCTTYGNTIRCH